MAGRARGVPSAGGSADRWVRWAEAVYRRASRLLPGDFRADYGSELVACFRDIAVAARRSRGRLAVVSALARSILDLVIHAPQQHLVAARAGVLGPGSGWSGSWLDVRQAYRRLMRRPAFAGASVVTLGLGIAASTAVFSLVHGVVLSPLPYPDSDRIVRVDHGGEKLGIPYGLGVTHGFYRFYAEQLEGAESIAMYQAMELTLTGAGEPVRLGGVRATPSLMAVLRARPERGRWFTAAEGEEGAARVVVLAHHVWRDRLGSDPGVLGSTVELGGDPWEVVGVMGDDFAFPASETDFWIPRVVPATGVGGWNELAVARLAPGVTPDGLAREMEGLYPRFREVTDEPGRLGGYLDDAGVFPRIVSLKTDVVGDVRATLWILLGTVGLVLLIAVANVTNLFLVRAEDGQRDTAVRTALGAGRTRIFRGLLAETLMVALAGGALGVAAAAAIVEVLKARAPVNVPRLHEVGLDATVVGVAVGTTVVAALFLGVVPALRRRGDLSESLKEGGARSTGSRRRLRGRNVLVAAQVALALVLLVGSGLLFRTFQELRAVDPGFTTRRALTFEVGLPSSRYPDRGAAKDFHDRLLERLRAVPGVESAAAVANCLPLAGNMCWGETLEAEGHPTPEGEVPPVTSARVVTTDYFGTLGVPVRGRVFTPGDARGAATVVVLSEAAAEAYFGPDDAVGRRIRFGPDEPWHTVVGIAGNVKGSIEDDRFQRVLYLPVLPETADGPWPGTMAYVLRTDVPPTSLAASARRAVQEIDAGLPLARVRPLQAVIDDATAPTAFALTLIGLAATMALLLGAVGVYAVVAYAVSRRTGEIGIRIAMGARRGDVQRMVLWQGGVVVLAGIAVGLVAAFALTRLMSGMLYGVTSTDPVAYAGVTVVMAAVATLALWLPARRASRVEPVEALKTE
jgi:putative ABC transport system permease protein